MLHYNEARKILKDLLSPFTVNFVHKENIDYSRKIYPLCTFEYSFPKEEWRILNVDGVEENRYKISSWGKVYDIKTQRYKSTYLDDKGYASMGLKGVNKIESVNFRIHRMVALSFIENSENKETVNHINLVKTNNCVVNLEWATNLENLQHATDNGRSLNKNKPKLLTEQEVSEIRERYSHGETLVSIAKDFNRKHRTISYIAKGKSYK